MDGFAFDALTRSLTTAGSRRRALVLALGGAFAPLLASGDAAAHDALLTCKKLKGAKKKKCLKKARKHAATHPALPAACVPNCSGKKCGPDGCGGSCGPCTGGTCTAGSCACPGGMDLCKGECLSPCTGDTARDPDTCGCCWRPAAPCNQVGTNSFCCSRICREAGATTLECSGQLPGWPCEFNEQCYDDVCRDGRCLCPNDWEACGGGCYGECLPGQIRKDPYACSCCVPNGSACGTFGACCSGHCNSGTCTGRALCDPCNFDEQCIDGAECQGDRCVMGITLCPD